MITITIPNLPRLQQKVAAAPRVVETELLGVVKAGALLIEQEARTLAPQDTRRLQGSIGSRINGLTAEIGPSVGYGIFPEKGTRPHWPPAAPLEGWARRHGIPVFLVQRSIARKGTRAQPFMQPAAERSVGRIEALAAKVGAKVVASMGG